MKVKNDYNEGKLGFHQNSNVQFSGETSPPGHPMITTKVK